MMQTRAAARRSAANATPSRHPPSSTSPSSSSPSSTSRHAHEDEYQHHDGYTHTQPELSTLQLRLQSPFHPPSASSSAKSSIGSPFSTPRVQYATTPSPPPKPDDLLRAVQSKHQHADRVTPAPVSQTHNVMYEPPAAPRRGERGGRSRGAGMRSKDGRLTTVLENEDDHSDEEEGQQNRRSVDGGKYRLRFEELQSESELEETRTHHPPSGYTGPAELQSMHPESGVGRKTLRRRWTLGG
ncbi:hypothetical protein VKT23_012722 [Stygiomarasmius scandens]|uniref:Uncharacterized protein n=1 Tax=Marasmiellus scandens TaxID=2682957 RepID=A0ABR1J5Q8_9AGAR